LPGRSLVLWLLLSLAGCVRSAAPAHDHRAATPTVASDVGFVVAAPDRGFLGDEELRDAFAELARGHKARLLFVTDDRTGSELAEAVTGLAHEGARRVVILPLFLTGAETGFQRLAALAARPGWALPVTIGRRFGESYLAVELLADRLRSIPDPAGRRVVVLGYGAQDEPARQAMAGELARMAERASAGFGFDAVRVAVWLDRSALPEPRRDERAESALGDGLAGGKNPALVPFQLGPKLDSMMSFRAGVAQRGDAFVAADVTPDPLVSQWLLREANRQLPLRADEIGVVVLAHGSDHHWNDAMENAASALARKYKVEFAFCMADPPLVERAIRRLEARGARGIVVVRVFGLESSFRASVEQMLGLDVEGGGHQEGHEHGHDHGHGHAAGPPGPRIRSSALFATVGGLEDHPLFAQALLDRARSLSKDPSKETVILVAHGSGDDATNAHWQHVLESLVTQMNAGSSTKFRAIRSATWREDWPDKRAPEVAAIRAMVAEAARDGGRAIVIPARTSAQGFESNFLDGLAFTLGEGFAPHPLFERWLDAQVQAGVAQLAHSH
jgi:sirohydrochlorin ferrochelatase